MTVGQAAKLLIVQGYTAEEVQKMAAPSAVAWTGDPQAPDMRLFAESK
jgi:hypothetical protein